MTSTPRIPLKAPILYCTLLALSMGAVGKYAEHRAQQLEAWKERFKTDGPVPTFQSIDLGSADPIEAQISGYMPSPDSGRLADMAGVDEVPPPVGVDEANPRSADAVRANRPPDWVYPPFDGAGHRERHGSPVTPTPRNITLRITDGNGEPLALDRLTAVQSGPDGVFEAKAYRTSDDPTEWVIGSPAISAGEYATFTLTGVTSDSSWSAVASVGSIPSSGDIELGTTVFEVH